MNKLQKLAKKKQPNTKEKAEQINGFKAQLQKFTTELKTVDNDSLGAFFNMIAEEMDNRKLLEPNDITTADIKDYLNKATEAEITKIQTLLKEEIQKRIKKS